MDRTADIAKRALAVEDVLGRTREFVEAHRAERTVEETLARARSFLALVRGDDVEKSLWGSPAGKKHLAKRIAAAIPRHRVYVEPFAGGAQVFWAKEPSEVEVLADRDPEIAFAFRFVKGLTAENLARLKRRSWVGDPERFRKLYESEPEDDVERFYRFAYLALFSFNKLRRGTMPEKNVGVESRFCERLEKLAPRLKDVIVRCADYEDVVDEFDGPETFFYLDPPYPGYDADVGHDDWDERRFGKVLRRIDGKFLATYGLRSEGADEIFKGFHVERWRHTSGVGAHQGQGLGKSVTLVVTNYRIRKIEDSGRPGQLVLPSIATAQPVDKTIWGSPAGKKRIAARLVKLIPPHKTYVEPFAGSAAVFFEKEPAEVEVLGDADPEIAFAFRAIKSLTQAELEVLRDKDWTGSERRFKALLDARPRSKVEKLYRFLYLAHFSYGKLRGKSFNPGADGVEARTLERIEQYRDRLKNAVVRRAHYADLVKEFDGPDTFFYLDPPYPGHNVEIGEDAFDEVEFRKVLDGIEGKFLVTYGTRGELDTRGFHVRKIRPPRSIRAMRGVGGPKTLPTLLIANYALTEKALGAGWALDEVLDVIDVEDDASDLPEVVTARLDKLAVAEIHPDRLRDLPDEELLSIHRRLHQLFAKNFAGNDRLSAGDLRREDLVNAELFVQDEMSRRGMQHEADDELARETEALRRTAKSELAPIHPSGEMQGREITLEEVLPHFQSFKLRAPFLYLVGGLANNGRTRNDIDVLVRGRLPEEMRRVIEFRLGRMLPPELSGRLQLLDDDCAGPFTDHVELADLVVEVRPTLDVKRMRLALKQDDPLLDLPKERRPHPAVLQYHFRGKSVADYTPILVRDPRSLEPRVIPISELFAGEPSDLLEKPIEGLEVWGRNGWERLSWAFRHPQTPGCRLLRVNCRAGVLDATADHSFFMEGVPVRGDELEVGGCIDLAPQLPKLDGVEHVDPEWAWVMGFFLAEGSVRRKRDTAGVFTQVEPEALERVERWARRYGLGIGLTHDRHAWRIEVAGLAIWSDFYWSSGHATETGQGYVKRVPHWVFRWDEPSRRAFVEGFVFGDGQHSKRQHPWCFAQKSQLAAQGVLWLMHSVGLEAASVDARHILYVRPLKNPDHSRALPPGEVVRIVQALGGRPQVGDLNPNFRHGRYESSHFKVRS